MDSHRGREAPHRELWERCASRRKDVAGQALRSDSGRLSGRPPLNGAVSLVAGLARGGVCGGGPVVETSPRKRGRIPEYVCHRHRHSAACTNALRVSVDQVNEQILSSIEEHPLTPEALEQVITALGAGRRARTVADIGVTSELLEKARKAVLDIPNTVFVRSGDALHLACAEEQGFQEVYTNDRHMLQAARYFHVTGVNVLSENG